MIFRNVFFFSYASQTKTLCNEILEHVVESFKANVYCLPRASPSTLNRKTCFRFLKNARRTLEPFSVGSSNPQTCVALQWIHQTTRNLLQHLYDRLNIYTTHSHCCWLALASVFFRQLLRSLVFLGSFSLQIHSFSSTVGKTEQKEFQFVLRNLFANSYCAFIG